MLFNFIRLAGWQLSGVAIGWMKIFPGWNLLCGNYPGWNFPGVYFPGEIFPGWEFSWVGVFLGRNCQGGTYPGWEFSLMEGF